MEQLAIYHRYTCPAQVDAIAVLPNTKNTLNDMQENTSMPLLATAWSALDGNQWCGGVTLLNTSLDCLCELQLDSGVSGIAWFGPEQHFLAIGMDTGEVEIVRLAYEIDYIFIPQPSIAQPTNAGHDDIITGISASILEPTTFASCSWDCTIKLWDLNKMASPITALKGHMDIIWDVKLSPTNANTVCSASQDSTIRIWDDRNSMVSSDCLRTSSPVLSVDWHPTTANVLAAGLENGEVLTFDLRHGKIPVTQTLTHEAAVHTIAYSPYESNLIASGGDDALIYIHDLDSSKVVTLNETHKHTDYIRSLAFLPTNKDSRNLASGSWDKTVGIWSLPLPLSLSI